MQGQLEFILQIPAFDHGPGVIKSGTSTRANPTHGSGWIVQVLPTTRGRPRSRCYFLYSSRREEKRNRMIITSSDTFSCVGRT